MLKEFYWNKSLELTIRAETCHALVPLKTTYKELLDFNDRIFELRFLIDRFPNVITHGPRNNPFNPWDNRLEVSSIGNEHVLILNKYPVQKGHMLLITKDWQPQSGWLSKSDWNAVSLVEKDTQGLWFFNSGKKSGASQPHRHIQLLPRSSSEIVCPRDYWFRQLIDNGNRHNSILERSTSVKRLKYNVNRRSLSLYESYLELTDKVGIGNPTKNSQPLSPYNIILTRDWMSIIKRKKESSAGFSINALGFAGYLLSTSTSNNNYLDKYGPDKLLEEVVETYL